MKKIFTSVLALAIGMASFAQQLPNAGFETWTDPKNPDGWTTWESATGFQLGLATKDTVSKAEGLASVKIKTDSIQAGPTKRLIPGFVFFGTAVYAPPSPMQLLQNPFAGRPDSLFFFFNYIPGSAADSARIQLTASGAGVSLLGVAGNLPSTNGNWIPVGVDLTPYYTGAGSVDSLSLYFSSSHATGVAGSTLHVDGIRFGYKPSVGINDLNNNIAVNVYPNPASSFIEVSSDVTLLNTKIEIVDIQGRVIISEDIVSNKQTIGLQGIANGNYLYKLISDNKVVKAEKLTIAK